MNALISWIFAVPLGAMVTIALFIFIWNELSPRPVLYRAAEAPSKIILDIEGMTRPWDELDPENGTVLCECGDWLPVPTVPRPSNSWIDSSKAAREAPSPMEAVGNTTVPKHSITLPERCTTISISGFCDVEFGMNLEEAISVFPSELYGLEYIDFNDPMDAACYYLLAKDENKSVAFMFVDGRIERMDITTESVSTILGAKVGMLLDEVQALYPHAKREPNFYTAPDENLVVTLNDNFLAIFESTNEEVVYTFRIGRTPPVCYVEGCS